MISSVGYEGRSVGDLVGALTSAGVTVLVDVPALRDGGACGPCSKVGTGVPRSSGLSLWRVIGTSPCCASSLTPRVDRQVITALVLELAPDVSVEEIP